MTLLTLEVNFMVMLMIQVFWNVTTMLGW